MRPKQLNVLGTTYAIKYHKDWLTIEGEEGIFAGLCHPDKHLIDVSLKGDPTLTLLHELIHAIMFEAALGQCKISEDAHEIICEQVAKVLAANFNLGVKR